MRQCCHAINLIISDLGVSHHIVVPFVELLDSTESKLLVCRGHLALALDITNGVLAVCNNDLLSSKIYMKGVHGEKHFEEAFKWFMIAAERGNEDAMYNVGTFYLRGWGVERGTLLH